MIRIDSRSSTSLSSARSNLVNDVQRNAADMAQAAQRIQKSFETENNRMAEANAPEAVDLQRTENRLNDRTLVESYNDGAARAIVDTLQAKQAYTASLKALEIVNDVENTVINLLR